MRTVEEKEALKDNIDNIISIIVENSPSPTNDAALYLIDMNCIIVAIGYTEAKGSNDYGPFTIDYGITEHTPDVPKE